MKRLLLSILVVILINCKGQNFALWVSNIQILNTNSDITIYSEGIIHQEYSEKTYNNEMNCRNGNLEIINNTQGNQLILQYANTIIINQSQINIQVQPNINPLPFINLVNSTHIEISFNCVCDGINIACNKENYYNKIKVSIKQYDFSFLLNCDPNNRHKSFQIGYLLISLISSSIIIGVAMHSHIWSIKIQLRPLRIELTWKKFLVFTVSALIIIFFAILLNQNQLINIFNLIKQVGIIYSIIFVFICLNQCFFLIKVLRREIYKMIRICDIISFICTFALIMVAFYVQNWIYYDILTGCICIGSIKLFHFNSLKQAISAITIMVFSVSFIVIFLHYVLPRSYNDYAGEISSPFVLQVPDLINNIYKKCSWLSNTDIVVPGVMLSYLRLYDQNKSSKFGGIYTVFGNLTFALSTILWMSIEFVYPYSVPFSLITNPLLILVIFIIAYKRNDWKTLYQGTFEKEYNVINPSTLKQNRMSFSDHIPNYIINESLLKQNEQKSSIY